MPAPASITESDWLELEQEIDELQERFLDDAARRSQEAQLNFCSALCESAGLPVIGIGGNRLAARLSNDKVIKFAWKAPGLSHNQIEWTVWRSADPPTRPLLAPCLRLSPGLVLVQRYCRPIEVASVPGGELLVRQLARAGIVDSGNNLGIIGQATVCYDYALLSPALATQLLAAAAAPPEWNL